MAFTTQIILYLVVSASTALCSCPDGWLHHENSCYHFSHDTESMLLASIVCQHMGGDLVEIETAAENNYLTAKIGALNVGNFWIGLSDIQEENIWLWYGSHNALAAENYVNWYPGEPNNAGHNENCVVMFQGSGKWVDVTCTRFIRYICEKPDEYEFSNFSNKHNHAKFLKWTAPSFSLESTTLI